MAQAYSYIRFSSEKQASGASLERQLQKAQAYALKHKLTLDHSSYRDLGISAFKGKNATEGALAAFIEAADAGRIPKGSFLLVESFDRLSREKVMTALRLLQDLMARDIIVVTLEDEQVFSTESIDKNWTQLIIAMAIMSRGNEENKIKAVRVQDAWDRRRKDAENGIGVLTSISPSWLTLLEDRKTWVIDKEKAAIVKTIFDFATQGYGSPTIARKLNDPKNRVPNLGYTTVGNRAHEWSAPLVSAVLKNRAVIGTYTPKKATADPIEGYYPAIISADDFYNVQQHISGRNNRGGVKGTGIANLFAGMTYCECGRRTRFVSGQKAHLYLRCLSAYGNTGCDAPTMPYNQIEFDLLTIAFIHTEASIQNLTTVVIDTNATAKEQLADMEKRIEKLLDLAEVSDSPRISDRIKKLEREIETLRASIKEHIVKKPLKEQWYETYLILQQHDELKEKGNAEEITALRLKLQAAIRMVITKVVLLKQEYKTSYGYRYRQAVLYGPITEILAPIINKRLEQIKLTPDSIADEVDVNRKVLPDGGCVIEFELPPAGFQPGNIRGRRVKK